MRIKTQFSYLIVHLAFTACLGYARTFLFKESTSGVSQAANQENVDQTFDGVHAEKDGRSEAEILELLPQGRLFVAEKTERLKRDRKVVRGRKEGGRLAPTEGDRK